MDDSQKRIFLQLFMLLGATFCMYLGMSTLVSLGIAKALDVDFMTLANSPQDLPNGRMWMLLLQGIVHGASFLGVSLLFWIGELYRTKGSIAEHETRHTPPAIYLLVALTGVVLLPTIMTLAVWNQELPLSGDFGLWAREMEAKLQEMIAFLTDFESPTTFIFALVVMAVLPALGEELLFRGLLQNQLRVLFRNPHIAIFLTAVLFSAIHLQFLGFFPRFLLGLWFGYLYFWTKNLWLPILAHFVHNGFTLLLVYLNKLNMSELDPDVATYPPWWFWLGSLIFSGILAYFIRKQTQPS